MLKFVAKLTLDSKSMQETDIQGLRDAGFGDVEILEIVQLAGWFNCITRIADALGAEIEPWRAQWRDELFDSPGK